MASYRPVPQSYYYSGQGRLGIGDRDPATGAKSNLIFVGNVTSLTVDIATTKFEHKESMSGDRAIDLTVVQEKNATFSFTSESLILSLLEVGLYGNKSTVAPGAVVSEAHTAIPGAAIPLKHANVSGVAVTGTGALVAGTDFQVDEGNGTVYFPASGGAITVPTAVTVSYTHEAYDRLDAFMTGTPPERFLRFEGLNTVNGDLRIIDIHRAAFDPLTGMEFINEELGSGEFNGNILPDLTIVEPGVSRYFQERRVYASAAATVVPSLVAAVVEDLTDTALDLTFSQALTSANPAGAGGFTIASTGAAVTVTGVAITGTDVTLTLSRAIAAGETMYLSYTPPGSNALAGANGAVAAFSGYAVTNNVV